MRRFAKPLYGLTPVPRVRIPPSPPDPLLSSQFTVVRASTSLAYANKTESGCIVLADKPTPVLAQALGLRSPDADAHRSVHGCAPQNVRAELVNIADNIRQHFVTVEVDSMFPEAPRAANRGQAVLTRSGIHATDFEARISGFAISGGLENRSFALANSAFAISPLR